MALDCPEGGDEGRGCLQAMKGRPCPLPFYVSVVPSLLSYPTYKALSPNMYYYKESSTSCISGVSAP